MSLHQSNDDLHQQKFFESLNRRITALEQNNSRLPTVQRNVAQYVAVEANSHNSNERHITSNEQSFLNQLSVLDRLAAPPGGESDSDTYLIIATASGVWATLENSLAKYDLENATWEYLTPFTGLQVYVVDEAVFYVYTGASWVVQSTLIDDTTKLAIADIDDVPVNAEVAQPISSNWAYDHQANPTDINHLTDAQIAALHPVVTTLAHSALSGIGASDHHVKTVSGEIDHASVVNTHNLTTDIDHDALTNFVAAEHVVINSGLLSAIPAAGNAGNLYIATDAADLSLWRDSGTVWVEVANTGVVDFLQLTGGTLSGTLTGTKSNYGYVSPIWFDDTLTGASTVTQSFKLTGNRFVVSDSLFGIELVNSAVGNWAGLAVFDQDVYADTASHTVFYYTNGVLKSVINHDFSAGIDVTGDINAIASSVNMDGTGTDDEALKLPYLTAAPATLVNGMMWMESDGLHIYYGGAEKIVAGV